ncbi:hypothetical protein PQQ99_07840 [Paraburkholderia sediminicola]|uniref:hypothetical protein n=1 Tax=Paraburkholderia sediminicola TaxID=458836 RepID=UPI0038BB06D9
MTLLVTFIVAHLGVIISGAFGLGGILFGAFRHQQAKTATAKASAVVAQAKATVTAGDAAAAQAGQTAAANRVAANQQAAAIPDAGLNAELAQLGALRKD